MTSATHSIGTVAWADTDASGRFHFTAAFRWVENAEHAMYRAAVPGIDIGRFPRRSVEASFERSVVAGDSFAVEFTSIEVGRSSIKYAWQVVGPSGVAVTGRHAVVHVGSDGAPAPVPDQLRAALASRGES